MDNGKKKDDCKCYGSGPKCPEGPEPPKPKGCCPCPCPVKKCNMTLKTVEKLVKEENMDVELTELLSGITELDENRPKKKILNFYDAKVQINPDFLETETHDVSPEYLAFIMSSMETGLHLTQEPTLVYEQLFSKGNPDAPLVALGPTAAISSENMVVPLSPPTVVNSLDPDMEKGSRLDTITPKLNTTLAEATMVDDVDDLKALLGGTTLESDNAPAEETTVDLLLETRAPIQSAVVLRGSTPPSWFPGYNVALPNTALPGMEIDPQTVLDEAWFHSQPLSLKLEDKGAKLIGS